MFRIKNFNSFYILSFPYKKIYDSNYTMVFKLKPDILDQMNLIAPNWSLGAIRMNETVDIWFSNEREAFDAYFQILLPIGD